MLDLKEIEEITLKHYNQAKKSIRPLEIKSFCENAAISDVIPGYSEHTIKFGAFEEDNFAVLFIDIRSSTKRAEILGAEKTFLTMHAFIPAMIEVIKYYQGNVIDIMGDGIMVFFGGRYSELSQDIACKNAGLCGRDMLKVKTEVVNKILKDDGIEWGLDCGVGIDYGKVIVTKIGVADTYDVKAFANCINQASKYSDGYDIVRVSKQIKEKWPSGKNGRISFSGSDGEGYILKDN